MVVFKLQGGSEMGRPSLDLGVGTASLVIGSIKSSLLGGVHSFAP